MELETFRLSPTTLIIGKELTGMPFGRSFVRLVVVPKGMVCPPLGVLKANLVPFIIIILFGVLSYDSIPPKKKMLSPITLKSLIVCPVALPDATSSYVTGPHPGVSSSHINDVVPLKELKGGMI